MATLFTLVGPDKQALLATYPFGVSAASSAGFPACGFTELSGSVAFSAGMNQTGTRPPAHANEYSDTHQPSHPATARQSLSRQLMVSAWESRASMRKALIEERIR